MQYYDVSEPTCTVMYILPSWPKEVLIKVVINKTNLGYWYLGSWTGPYFSEKKKNQIVVHPLSPNIQERILLTDLYTFL